MRIIQNGKVGINVTSPVNMLDINTVGIGGGGLYVANDDNDDYTAHFKNTNGTAPVLYLQATGSDNNDTAVFRVDVNSATRFVISNYDGNVGIGTDSPTTNLHVEDATYARATVEKTSGAWAFLGAATNSGVIVFMEGKSFHIGQKTNITDGSWVSQDLTIDDSGDVGIANTAPCAPLHIKADPANTSQPQGANNAPLADSHTALFINGTGGALNEKIGLQFGSWSNHSIGGIFGIAKDSADETTGNITFDMRKVSDDVSLTEVMTITNTGNVGIGQLAPAVILDIGATTASAPVGYAIRLHESDTKHWDISTTGGATSALRGLQFSQSQGGVAMTLRGDGKVCIGETSPAAPLQVGATTGTDPITTANMLSISVNKAFSTGYSGQLCAMASDYGQDYGGMVTFAIHRTSGLASPLPVAAIAGRKEEGTSSNYAGYLHFGT